MAAMGSDAHGAALAWACEQIGGSAIDAEPAGRGDNAATYRLCRNGTAVAYLKVGGGDLSRERDRLVWLAGRVSAPSVVAFAEGPEQWLLTGALRGLDLSRPEHTDDPSRLVGLLASALRRLHALDAADCPFVGDGAPRGVIVHGDACLPNVLFDGATFAGFVDLGELRIGDPAVDLAAALWSLDLNVGPGYGGSLLRAYGWPDVDDGTVERLRRAYPSG
jgi:aminoglycoside phosphotransferase